MNSLCSFNFRVELHPTYSNNFISSATENVEVELVNNTILLLNVISFHFGSKILFREALIAFLMFFIAWLFKKSITLEALPLLYG